MAIWRRRRTPSECREAAALLQRELDGALDGAEHVADIATLHHHLEICRDCGLDAATYRAIKTSLAQPARASMTEQVVRLQQFAATLPAQT